MGNGDEYEVDGQNLLCLDRIFKEMLPRLSDDQPHEDNVLHNK